MMTAGLVAPVEGWSYSAILSMSTVCCYRRSIVGMYVHNICAVFKKKYMGEYVEISKRVLNCPQVIITSRNRPGLPDFSRMH